MKINVDRKAFEAKLQVAITAIGNKTLIPILDEALIEVSENKMVVTTSNTQITVALNVFCETDGELTDFVCDIKTILSTISLLKSEVITLEIEGDNVIFSTPKTRKRYEVPITYKADDFPIPSSDKWNKPTVINGAMFAKMIKRTSLFVNPNDLRAGLQGVNIKGDKNEFVIQGTNANVAAVCKIKSKDGELGDVKSVIVPRSIANISMHFEKSVKLEISVDSGGKMLKLYDGTISAYVLLLDGAFPPLESLYKGYVQEVNLKVNKESLLLAIKRISLFSDYTDKSIKFDLAGDNIVLKGDNNNRKKAEELIEVNSKSEEMSFITGYNHTYLASMLNNMDGEDIYLSQTKFNTPCFLEDNASEGFQTQWLIAPINIQENKPSKD